VAVGVKEVEASKEGVGKCLLGDRGRAGRAVTLQQHVEYPSELSRASHTHFTSSLFARLASSIPDPIATRRKNAAAAKSSLIQELFGRCRKPLTL